MSNVKRILSKKSEQGQIAVAILLIMTVMLTVAVSMAVRTTEEISVSTQQNESTKVFNAAETGVEVALRDVNFENITSGPTDPQGATSNEATYTYVVTPQTTLTSSALEGQSTTIQLSPTSQQINISWANPGVPAQQRAAILVATYYANGTVEYQAIGDSDATGRSDEFSQPNGTPAANYAYAYSIPSFGSAATMLRIIPVYNNTELAVTGTNLPVQQHVIRSEAVNDNSGSNNLEKRTIEVRRSIPTAPSFFDYSLYAKGSIVKEN